MRSSHMDSSQGQTPLFMDPKCEPTHLQLSYLGLLFLFFAAHLSHYQPTPVVTYFKHSLAPPAISGALRESPALFLAAFCPQIASWNPRIVRSSRSGAQPQSKDYLRAGRKVRKGRWCGWGVARREEVKEGRKEAAWGEWDIASADFPNFFFLSGDTITGASFWRKKNNPHHTVLVSSFPPECFCVWAQRQRLVSGNKLGQNEVEPQMQGGFRCHQIV